MKLIDSHAHISFDKYDEDRAEIIDRAFSDGITHIIQSCDNLIEIKKNLEISKSYDNIFTSIGIHPHEAKTWTDQSKKEILTYIKNEKKILAIGECGLDYYYDLSPRDQQQLVFKEQIKIAKEVNLPLIIHTRDAACDTISILKNESSSHNGVFHCYTGDKDTAIKALELGFYISFSGIITFKNAVDLRDVAKNIPLDKMLIETDCPFLTPMPFRGRRNEPSYVKYVAEEIAKIHNISIEEVAFITSENTKKLFNIK